MPAVEVEYDSDWFARGSFGSVHHGVWLPGTKVVVKVLRIDESGMNTNAVDSFVAEIDISIIRTC